VQNISPKSNPQAQQHNAEPYGEETEQDFHELTSNHNEAYNLCNGQRL